jgi:hypothetical protein
MLILIERKHMKHFAVSLILVFLVFAFLSCERPETQVTGPKLEYNSSAKPGAGDNLPDPVVWNWRRVWTDGHHSNYGANNANGTRASGGGVEGNWCFEETDGSWVENWSSDNGTRVTNSFIGTYAVTLQHTWTYPSPGGYSYLDNDASTNIGAAIAEDDDIAIGFWVDDLSDADQLDLSIKVWNYNATLNSSYAKYWEDPVDVSTWTYYEKAFNGFSWDVGYIYIGANVDYGFVLAADENETAYVTMDDIRLYSSAEDLPPAARFYDPTDETAYDTESEPPAHYFFANMSLSNVAAEEFFDVFFVYEDPDDGLYYSFSQMQRVEFEGEPPSTVEYDQSIFASGWSNLQSHGSLDLLPTTYKAGVYKIHMNEYDRFTITAD